ncbi:sensor domain-containing diguanylate cyclase [Thauera linaloolentis]|uniref:Putative signaling-related membrane protein n=1 Tax=Thauera linaloolentis (strain DSM 12138 / JCM 21573 / CCUG 41526 / CIP 105981 / IAM 15112 / NBRC 102519 / 47Lol) TaxID=1123367 RepID=N6YT77_THAL4|nr:sensor domain-containing diguanylate cyclase [Thauera linaloolentis]ENO85358.1 putative signaling-related membrane protein [Thauera linaloolentis 47Lol = DSM 12138]MCM8567668.1 diguanylate cyclase [Thauera linaloolentis]
MTSLKRTTLFQALHRTYSDSTVLAIALAGTALFILTLLTLKGQIEQHLQLVARTIAYSAEAAVLFEDRGTASEILVQIAEREQLRAASITTLDGRTLASHGFEGSGLSGHVDEAVGRLLFPDPIGAEIRSGNRRIGKVAVHGNGARFIVYTLQASIVGLVCITLFFYAARRLARRMAQRITNQLQVLAAATHGARLKQDFSRRVPPFDIVEFDQLGKDFNALFAELHARNLELTARQYSLEVANQTLSQLALRDGLTGLANRRGFIERLEQALAEAKASGSKVGVLYLDNDRFKRINDEYGHAAGDALLVEVADRIRGCIRDTDLVARLGGDEFTVLLDSVRDVEDAILVAEKILAAMVPPLPVGDTMIVPGVSIGIALFPEHGRTADQLLIAADQAMYTTKQNGRGHYRIFDPAIHRLPTSGD